MSTSPPHHLNHDGTHPHQINGHQAIPATNYHHPQDQVVILIVPLPAQGHLNQLLQLSHLIASAYPHIPIHFAASATHTHQALIRSSTSTPSPTTNIHFHNFPTPPFPSPPPIRNSSHKFPSHLLPAFRHANVHLYSPVSSLIRSLSSSSKRLVVINDSLMASVVRETQSLPNTESYTFHSVSAYNTYWFIHRATLDKKHRLLLSFPQDFLYFVHSHYEYKKHSSGCIMNTCRVLEGSYVDMLQKESRLQLKHWAVGPFNSVGIKSKNNTENLASYICTEWLDKQEQNSVLYVSFGTTTSMCDEQVKELAIGLEKSGHKFIWVLREADRGDVFSRDDEEEKATKKFELPDGFEERVNGVGLVVRDWAPQLRILGHASTGGFMSHCGWNSCMESLSMGVPLAAWPMHSDQPKNSELVTKVLKVGITVREWGQGGEEVVRAREVERVVKKLMGSGEGEEMRRRAAELGADVRKSVDEGGDSRAELDSFIAHISR